MHTFDTREVDRYARELAKQARFTHSQSQSARDAMAARFLVDCANARCTEKIMPTYKHCPHCGKPQSRAP